MRHLGWLVALAACDYSDKEEDSPGRANGDSMMTPDTGPAGPSDTSPPQDTSEPPLPEPTPTGDGWLLLPMLTTGSTELYLVKDDGSEVVQLTEGITIDRQWPMHAEISRDGSKIVVASRKQPDAPDGNTVNIWVMNSDGANLQPVRATGWGAPLPVGWAGNSTHVVLVDSATCSENVIELDIVSGATRTLYDRSNILRSPVANPANPNEVVVGNYSCGGSNPSSFLRIDVAAGTHTEVPGFDPVVTNWYAYYTSDGSGMVVLAAPQKRIEFTDFTTRSTLYEETEEGVVVVTPALGNDDRVVYFIRAETGGGAGFRELLALDRETGTTRTIGVTDVDWLYRLSWARVHRDIDRDGDGLANGIDPTPDG